MSSETAQPELDTQPHYEIADIPVFDPWAHGVEIPFDENDTCATEAIIPFLDMSTARITSTSAVDKSPRNRFLVIKTVAGQPVRTTEDLSFKHANSGRLQAIIRRDYRDCEPVQRIQRITGVTKFSTDIIRENNGSVKIVSDDRGKFSVETLIGMGIFTGMEEVFGLLYGVRGSGDNFLETNIPAVFFDLETGTVIEIGRLFVVPTYEDDKDRITLGVAGQKTAAANTGIKKPSALFLFDSVSTLADFLSRKRIFEADAEQPTTSPLVRGLQRKTELLAIMASNLTIFPAKMRNTITSPVSDPEDIGRLGALSDTRYKDLKAIYELMSDSKVDLSLKEAVLEACKADPKNPTVLDHASASKMIKLAGFVAKWKPDGKKTLYQSLPPELRAWLDPFVKPNGDGGDDRFGMLEID